MSDSSNGIPFLRGSDLKNGFLDVSNSNYITKEKHKDLTSGHLKFDDIVIAVRGSLGVLGYVRKDNAGWNINSQLAIIRTDKKELLGKFLIQYLLGNRGQKELLLRNTGTALKQLPIKQLKDVPIPIPSIKEQTKIGGIIQELDHLITLHQRKLDKLQLLKKYYLQSMLPKDGASVPQLRFANFEANWEHRKLGEITKITMGQSPNSDTYTDNPSDHILVQGNADMKNGRVVPRVWTTQVTKKGDKKDLILSVRAPVGDIGITSYDVVLGRGVAAIKGNEFVFQSLLKMKQTGYWKKLSTGSTFDSINSNDIKNADIMIPNNAEQKKIGLLLSILDNLITLQQKKMRQFNYIKRFLLQKMFL